MPGENLPTPHVGGPTSSTTGPSAADPTTAAANVSSNANLAESSSTTINSLADLRRKSPKVYKFMMLSIAQNMCTQMGRQNDRLIEELKKLREHEE